MWRSPAPVSSVTGGSWCLSRVAGVLGDGGEWVRAGQRPLGSPIPLAAERPARDPARGVVGEGGRQPTGGVRGARGGEGRGAEGEGSARAAPSARPSGCGAARDPRAGACVRVRVRAAGTPCPPVFLPLHFSNPPCGLRCLPAAPPSRVSGGPAGRLMCNPRGPLLRAGGRRRPRLGPAARPSAPLRSAACRLARRDAPAPGGAGALPGRWAAAGEAGGVTFPAAFAQGCAGSQSCPAPHPHPPVSRGSAVSTTHPKPFSRPLLSLSTSRVSLLRSEVLPLFVASRQFWNVFARKEGGREGENAYLPTKPFHLLKYNK